MTTKKFYDKLQVRKAGWTLGVNGGRKNLWVITAPGDDSPLAGPDRWGGYALSFPTEKDAIHAARDRAETVERGPAW